MSGDNTAFFYGTLMAPEVFFTICYNDSNPAKVIQDMHTFTPAILDGYCRHRVKSVDYPGIIAEDGHSVRGVYVTGLTDASMEKLDLFEGSEYNRENAKVRLLQETGGKDIKGEDKDTVVYVFKDPENLERGEWDYKRFREEKLRLWINE